MTSYKFQRLTVYNMALDYLDKVYVLSRSLPASERFNLQSQLERAATSIVLNIAEGSTSQSDGEQNRFLGLALRSYLETIACMDIIERQGYLDGSVLEGVRAPGHDLFVRLQAFRKALQPSIPRSPRSPVSRLPSPVRHSQSSVSGLQSCRSNPPSSVPRLRSSVEDSQ
jgi:four helix bundle protein